MIQTENLHIGVKEACVENINLKGHGKLIGLAGQNGCGKSTFLKTLSGFISPISGTIDINEIDLKHYSRRTLARSIAVSFASNQVYGNASFRDIAALGRLPYLGLLGRLNQRDSVIVEESLELFGIQHLLHKQFKQASDGERQKCLLARCFAQQTPIMLLDEPTAFLDHPSRMDLYTLLKEKSKTENKTIVVSGHDLHLLEDFCDEIWLIHDKLLVTSNQADFSGRWEGFKKGKRNT